MRAVLYCRVSTVEQVQNLSLGTQEKACREFCEREGYEVAKVFVDRGESAKTTARPEFQALLTYCREHRKTLHAVIVYGLSRFSRNNADHHTIAALLRSQGIALRSVTEPIDDSPAGKFMEAILAGMAQFDNDLRADRTKVGMKAAVSKGRWVWKAPLGYRNGNTKAGEPSLVPDPARAGFITNAFAHIAAGMSQSEVQRQMTVAGLDTVNRREVAAQTWAKVLRNPVYVGRLVTSFGTQDGDWTPLINASTFARAQAALGPMTSRPRLSDAPDFPLRRFVRCACGKPLTGGWSRGKMGKRYAYYNCPDDCVTTTRADLEHAFLEQLGSLTGEPGHWPMVREDLLRRYRQEASTADADRAQAERRARDARERLRHLDDAYLVDRVIDRDTYQERRGGLRVALEHAEAALSSAMSETWDVEALLDFAIAVTLDASRLWTMAPDAAARVRLQWVLFPEGLIWTGSSYSNPRNCWTLSTLEANRETDSRMASPSGDFSNRIQPFFDAWRAYQVAA